jgi:hypothetical protein
MVTNAIETVPHIELTHVCKEDTTCKFLHISTLWRPFPTFSISIVRVIKARRMRWAGHVVCMGELRGAYNILVGRPEERRPQGRPRRRWEDNIKMDLREIGFGDVDWIHWAQDRVRWWAFVNTVMNLQVP